MTKDEEKEIKKIRRLVIKLDRYFIKGKYKEANITIGEILDCFDNLPFKL